MSLATTEKYQKYVVQHIKKFAYIKKKQYLCSVIKRYNTHRLIINELSILHYRN